MRFLLLFSYLDEHQSGHAAIWTFKDKLETTTKFMEFLFDLTSKQSIFKTTEAFTKKLNSNQKNYSSWKLSLRSIVKPEEKKICFETNNPSAGKQPQLHLWYWKYFNYKQIDCLCHMPVTQRTRVEQTEHETITKKVTALVIKQHSSSFRINVWFLIWLNVRLCLID